MVTACLNSVFAKSLLLAALLSAGLTVGCGGSEPEVTLVDQICVVVTKFNSEDQNPFNTLEIRGISNPNRLSLRSIARDAGTDSAGAWVDVYSDGTKVLTAQRCS